MLARFLEPFIEFGKLTVVEVSARDNNTIDIAASLVERVVGQRAPQVDTNKIVAENGREVGGHHLKKVGQIPRDIFR